MIDLSTGEYHPGEAGQGNVVTTDVNGQKVTATFQLATLTDYKDLKASMTATKTVSAASGVETVEVIVFAGGVIYALAGMSYALFP